VARRAHHLRQIADLDIRSQNAIAHHEFNRKVGIFCLQLAHHFDGGIGRIADAEDHLKLGIILFAVTAKVLPDLGIDTLQRLEYRDRRQGDVEKRGFDSLAAIAQETSQANGG
jgi:hypothetical protein